MAEMRLIDANALLKSFDVAKMVEYDETGCGVTRIAIPVQTIKDAPTIDAVPVVHGHYGFIGLGIRAVEIMFGTCSACRERIGWYGHNNFCPNCGAKMDAKEE